MVPVNAIEHAWRSERGANSERSGEAYMIKYQRESDCLSRRVETIHRKGFSMGAFASNSVMQAQSRKLGKRG